VSELHETTGSYVLNALDSAELREFEVHLATCDICPDEIAAFGRIAAELSVLQLADPPDSLRTSILDAIRTTPQLSAETAPARAGTAVTTAPATANGTRHPAQSRRAARAGGPRRALAEPAIAGGAEPVDELAQLRQRRQTRILSGLVAAMLALAVGLGGVVYSLVQQRQAQVAQITLEEQLYAAPDARTVTVPLEAGGQVTFIASKQLDRALFIGTDLPDPGPDNRYQLWTGTGDPTAENGITGVSRDNQVADTDAGAKVFFSGRVTTADFLAVNVERVGSTPDTPTTAVLAAGTI
jgi:anti-sigma factor RsiW